MIFGKQIAYFQSFDDVLNDELQKAISSFGFVIKDYVVNKQLFQKGIDGDGNKLRGYKRITIQLKRAKGQPTDRTTLRDEGTFHASIEVRAYEDSFEVSSNVSYDKYLIDPSESYYAYGYHVLKPTKENMTEFFKTFVIPQLRKTIQEGLR
jgi:hypothetical protein